MRRWIAAPDSYGLSPEARAAFPREQAVALTIPVGLGLMEGGFVGVIADKMFHAHPAVLALIIAAPMFGNLSSFLWAGLAHGRRKVPVVTACQTAFVLCIGLVAFLPAGPAGTVGLAVSMVAARLAVSGIITIRSTVWSLNYPREVRGRLVGRLVVIATLTVACTTFLGSILLDANPANIRIIYIAGACAATLGVLAYAGVRVRGEGEHLALETGAARSDAAEKPASGASVTKPRALTLLRDDPLFSRYLSCQFVLGVGNMMIEAPVIYVVSHQLQTGYLVSIALTTMIPMLVMTLTTPLWGAYLDRVHVAEFRARASVFWISSQVLTWWGAWTGSLGLIALGRTVLGVGRGGGRVAWQLGHNDFADPRVVNLYMGIHVTLTGVRGAFAPFLGMLLFTGWRAEALPFVPSFSGIGAHVMLLAALCSAIAGLGFAGLHRRVLAEARA